MPPTLSTPGLPDIDTMGAHGRPSQAIPLVLVLEEINFGGTQRQMLELARHLDKSLFKPEIWTLRQGDAFLPMAQKYDIPVRQLCDDATLEPWHGIRALYKEFSRVRPPIVHLHTTFPNMWGRILGRLCSVPVIVGSIRSKRNVHKQKERYTWRLTHTHICNAASLYEDLLQEGLQAERLYTIPNGVDVEFFTPPEQGLCKAPHIVNVGRLAKEKDQATLLRAFAWLVQRIPEAHLHMVGDGYLREALEAQAAELGIQEQVTFHGGSTQVKDFLAKARVFVLSSIDEGTPNAILEAMAMGLPIVSTAVDGVPAMVEERKNALLAPLRDAETLGQHLLTVLSTEGLAESMGAAAREHVVENYSLQLMARRHEAVYLHYYQQAGLAGKL